MTRVFWALLAFSAPFTVQAQDLKETVRKALHSITRSDERLSNYGFVRHTERKEFNADGSVKTSTAMVLKRELHEGFPVTRPVERDGKPLSDSERKQIETAIAKRIGEMRGLSPEQRRKQAEEAKKKERETDAWMNEVPEAFDWKLVGEELVAGRPTLVIDATPRPGYQPGNMRAKILPKMRGRLWIDKADVEMVRADAEVFDEVNIALGLAGHVDKGTKFHLQRSRIADGLWASTYEHARFSARVMVFKKFNAEVVSRTSNYVQLRNIAPAAVASAND